MYRLPRMMERLQKIFCGQLLVLAIMPNAFADVTSYSRQRIDDVTRMELAADQLVRLQLPSGFFPYDYNFATGEAEDMKKMSGVNLLQIDYRHRYLQRSCIQRIVACNPLENCSHVHSTAAKSAYHVQR